MNKYEKKIGSTSLHKTTVFRQHFKLEHAYIKDESENAFGTIKDRRNLKIYSEASRLKVDKLVLITSGNNGYSLARIVKDTSIKVVCVISKGIVESIKKELKNVAYDVIEMNLDHKILRPEELIAFSREKEDEVIWDVTNGYEDAYAKVVEEICKDVIPDYIVTPVGSGGIYMGLIEGVNIYCPKAKVIGIGVQNTYNSFGDKLSTPWTPYAKALEIYSQLGHTIIRLSESEIKQTYQKYKNICSCEPSSSIVFAAPDKIDFKPNSKIVFINSGKGHFFK